MPRLFTGLEIPADIAQALSMLRGGLPGARWIDPENYHLTLRFIGEVDRHIADDLASTLTRILGFIAVVASTVNVVSGYLITDRMLKMFKKRGPEKK